MRILKLVLISAVAFFVLMLAFSLLIPSQVRISRAVDINTNRVRLMPLVSGMEGWARWNPYVRPGNGSALTVESVTDSLVKANWLAGGKQFKTALAIYDLKSGTLTVQWYVDFQLRWYPWEKFSSILYDKQLGPIMDESLRSLKTLAESDSKF